MLPSCYFDVICCPRCQGALTQLSATVLSCARCSAEYPVVEGIPVLLAESDDAVSRIVRAFYEVQWQRDEQNRLRAKVLHEDITDYGQRYIQVNERRFLGVLDGRDLRFFLDAGCGAQPRAAFAQGFRHHVCVDFSLDGLFEARARLPESAILVVGSLLQLPIRTDMIGGALASHCIYHIDEQRQGDAIAELHRVLAPGGKLLIFYANPRSLEGRAASVARALVRGERRPAPPTIYFRPLPVRTVLQLIRKVFGPGQVQVRALRLVSVRVSQPAFRVQALAPAWYRLLTSIERLMPGRVGAAVSTYVAYIAHKS